MILVEIYHRVENGDSQSHRVKVTECAVPPTSQDPSTTGICGGTKFDAIIEHRQVML